MNTKDINGPAPEEQSGENDGLAGNTGKKADKENQGGEAEKTGDPEEKKDAGPADKAGDPEEKKDAGPADKAGDPEENMDSGEAEKAGDPEENMDSGEAEKAGGPEENMDSGPAATPGKAEDEGGPEAEKTVPAAGDDYETGKAEPSAGDKPAPGDEAEAEKDEPSAGDKPGPVEEPAGKDEPDSSAEPTDDDKPSAGDEAEAEKVERSAADKPAPGQNGDPESPGKPRSLNYQDLDKEQLLKALEELLESPSVAGVREDVEAIKSNFYKTHKAEIEQKRKRFMQEGGEAEAFDPGTDPREERFKELYRKYRHSKAAHNRSLDSTRQSNLEAKLKVIEDLKELVGRTEDINRSFSEFRKLQKRWHETGMVPQQNLRDLWDTYHHHVEMFYDQVKIDKELRDLDLKKNLETKIELCEKAEELLLEPNIINAFRKLQKIHDQWRETGPVPRDQKDAIWERLREITHQINKKHQEHFDKLKDTQKKNLETKTALCEKAEMINETTFESFQQVEKLTREMVNLQKTWKTIGFAPRKDNARIYNRFRNVTDRFFARKREYTSKNKEFLNENLQKKIDLCIQAEAYKDSTDWKRTTDELIALQKKWKEIGPVPRKHYDPVWKRFRAACDHFFDKKAEHFSGIDARYEENLRKKLELIEKIENFKFGSDLDASLNTLKEYQREWVSIGFVPIKEKEKIQKQYRAALDRHFEGLKVDDNKKNLMKFRHKLEGVRQKPKALNKMKFEREKFLNRYKQLESDITLWENNIGFFAKSRSAEATIREFREKIEQGKKQMAMLEEKIRMIDEMDPE